jgi:GTP-binding protein
MARDDVFQTGIREQADIATAQADLIVFLVDGRTGITADDEDLAKLLKKTKKPVFLVVNKVDDPGSEQETYEFYNLGLGTPYAISATHGTGTGDLLDELVAAIPAVHEVEDDDTIKLAIIGRPNAGKSSLTNRLAGAERSIVSDVAGTTRDAIDLPIQLGDREYTLIDTAGIRRKANIDTDVEYYGFVRAMRAIDRCNVALLVIDAEVGLTDQDQRIASYASDRGCAIVVLLNKWDLLHGDGEDDSTAEVARDALIAHVEDRLDFIRWAPVLRISALTGKNVHRVMAAVDAAYDHYCACISTSALNRLLTELREFGHTVSRGPKSLRINYVTQTHNCPPGFTFFCNYPQLVDDTYRRYLENRLREAFELEGTPVFLKFKKKSEK